MNIRDHLDFLPLRIALGALALAVAAALWAVVSATREPSESSSASPTVARVAPLRQIARAPAADIDAAVDQDPFAPDRSAPSEPFHMPGEEVASSAPAAPAQPKPTVLGTAVGPAGSSFATAQLGDAAARIVRAGDKLGPYTVLAIARGRVEFRTADGDRLVVAAQAASTQETANASLDTATTLAYPGAAAPGAGRAFFGFRAGQGRRGRRGASPDTTGER